MINKRSIWFLTLFSLILVLSVYYITMPSELLLNTNGNYTPQDNEPTTNIEESTILVSLRVEAEEKLLEEMAILQLTLTNNESSIEEKNEAFEKMKDLNAKRGEEEVIENKIKEVHKLESFVKITNDQIEVVIKQSKKSVDLANKIMRTVQEHYEIKKYITVKFTN